ncbi:hypothetical protein [Lactococcus lactis]|uniref:hypothetical protein n=1 Tax=Lactococcus lactis TaxID=1358 RepID=UPI00071CAE47|nr:hypothetical protein [Lactococcus lactis]
MTKYLLLDIDDTIAPQLYRGSDAVEIETWGRGHLAIPRYILDWLKNFSKGNNQSIWWCTDRTNETTQIESQLKLNIQGKLRFDNVPRGVWKKQASIIKFAVEHPKDIVICADNDADLIKVDTLPKNLHLVIPTGTIKALSKEDLNIIDSY